jgi:hypothetical protein
MVRALENATMVRTFALPIAVALGAIALIIAVSL